MREFLDYLADFVARRRREMRAGDNDIVARLLRWESDGYRLSPVELHHQCIFLLNAGHETTTNLIGNGLELLQRFPNARAALVDDPELIGPAIEEILRFESSNQLGNRTATESVEIRGVAIPAGSVLTLCIGAANRDPSVFADPDTFDIRRHPNPHLAFAAGIHTCAGLNVARLEGQVAIAGFLRRFPNFELAATPRRNQRARFRGFETLPLRL